MMMAVRFVMDRLMIGRHHCARRCGLICIGDTFSIPAMRHSQGAFLRVESVCRGRASCRAASYFYGC